MAAPPKKTPRRLSNIRKIFGYKDSFRNLLSNLQISRGQYVSHKNLNLLHLHENTNIYLANNEKMLSNKTPDLFSTLRIIKNIYENIKSMIEDSTDSSQTTDRNAKELRDIFNELYHFQSDIYLALYENIEYIGLIFCIYFYIIKF